MIETKICLWKREEYRYPKAGTFIPAIHAMLHDDGKTHPAMLVVPGGGYVLESAAEAAHVGHRFYDMDFNVFVLVYTNDLTMDEPVYPQAVKDIARAVRVIRRRADETATDPERIFAVGSSAGGHLVGTIALRFDDREFADEVEYADVSAKLTGAVLVYPIINDLNQPDPVAEVFVEMMIGKDAPESIRRSFRLENYLRKDAPPMCIFAGAADAAVGCISSAEFVCAALKEGMDVEYHLFGKGCHGFAGIRSSADEIKESAYVYDQLYGLVQGADPETLAKYSDIILNLNKDMGYEEFTDTAAAENYGVINGIMQNADWETFISSVMQGRCDIDIWFDIAEDWIKNAVLK